MTHHSLNVLTDGLKQSVHFTGLGLVIKSVLFNWFHFSLFRSPVLCSALIFMRNALFLVKSLIFS